MKQGASATATARRGRGVEIARCVTYHHRPTLSSGATGVVRAHHPDPGGNGLSARTAAELPGCLAQSGARSRNERAEDRLDGGRWPTRMEHRTAGWENCAVRVMEYGKAKLNHAACSAEIIPNGTFVAEAANR